MGRAKQSMKLIREGRIRNITFRKRKEGLKKKARELSILCDVKVCLIMYGPAMDEPTTRELEIWPPNQDNVQSLIESYENQSNEDRDKNTKDLLKFFEEKCQSIENDLTNLQKKNEIAKYATWDKCYENFSQEQLREFGNLIVAKLTNARNRIETIKSTQIFSSASTVFNDCVLPQHQPVSSSFNPNENTFTMNYYPFHQTQQGQIEEEHLFPNHSLMMMNNSGSYYNSTSQFGAVASNTFPHTNGCFADSTLDRFSGSRVGYFGNNNTDTQMLAMQYMKPEDILAYEQIIKSLNH